MTLTDWLKDIMKPLVSKPEEADLLLAASDLRAVEIPEELQKAFAAKYMTPERAMTDETVLRKVQKDARGMVFGSVDQKLKKILPKFSQEDQDRINTESDTLLKLELFEKALDNISKNDDVKKINEQWRKKEEELHEEIKKRDDAIKLKEDSYKSDIRGVKIDYALRNKLASMKLAPEFDNAKHRTFLEDFAIQTLKKSYVLDFDEKDPSIIQLRKNVDGAITDVFDGNNKLTIDDVLQKEYEPYLLRNNSGNSQEKQKEKIEFKPETPKPVTLRDMQMKAAGVQ